MREPVDLVDENDHIVGVAERDEAHGKLPHRAVHIFVFNSKGELFIQQRSLSRRGCPGMWDSSAAGHVDSGESYESAAKRELKEELGIHVNSLEFITKLAPAQWNSQEFIVMYKCIYDGTISWNKEEVMNGKFLTLDQLYREIKSEKFTSVFKKLLFNLV
jgi:isopentenyl-diphosphate delta-isomerase type 1